MTQSRLLQIANNTFLAVDSPTSVTLIGAVHRFARIRDHLGFDELARQSEANYGMTKYQLVTWELAAKRALGIPDPINTILDAVDGLSRC